MYTIHLCDFLDSSSARKTTVNTTTPSGPSYDRGARFCVLARQGSKKLTRKKLLVESVYIWGQEYVIEPSPIP